MENRNNVPTVPFAEVRDMAQAIANSGLYGIKRPEQAVALMLVAQAEGRHPAIAARDYHIVDGRPALKADAMLARFQEAGGNIKWIELSDTCAKAEFSHPKGGALVLDWTIERARQAGLAGRDTWRKYPRSMLKARLISDGIRAVFPGVICGTYTPEEEADIAADKREARQADAVVVGTSPDAQAGVSEPAQAQAPKRGKRSQAGLLKAAAEKAAVVDVTPEPAPAEPEAEAAEPAPAEPQKADGPSMADAMRQGLKQSVERNHIENWLNGARTLAENGSTAPELKQDAIKAFGEPLPPEVKSFLLDVWNRSRNQAPEPAPDPEPVEPAEGFDPLPY